MRRYICEGENDRGFVKIHVAKESDHIYGATIVSRNAGDMISEITTCMQHGVGLSQLAGTIHPYPTHQEAVRQVWQYGFVPRILVCSDRS